MRVSFFPLFLQVKKKAGSKGAENKLKKKAILGVCNKPKEINIINDRCLSSYNFLTSCKIANCKTEYFICFYLWTTLRHRYLTFSFILRFSSLVLIPNCHTWFQAQICSEKKTFWKFSKLGLWRGVCGWLTRRNVTDSSMHMFAMYNVWLYSSVGRASYRFRGSHGFESRWSPDNFRLFPSICLNWKKITAMITLYLHLKPQYKYEFHMYFTSFHRTGRYELNKLTGIAEVTDSNPVSGFFLPIG